MNPFLLKLHMILVFNHSNENPKTQHHDQMPFRKQQTHTRS